MKIFNAYKIRQTHFSSKLIVCRTLALILKSKGWSEFGQEDKKNNIFAILSGEVDQDIQKHIITIFNIKFSIYL